MSMTKAPPLLKSPSRTSQKEARLCAATVSQLDKRSKRKVFRVQLGLGDPLVTPDHPYTNFLVEEVVKVADRYCHVEDKIFQLEMELNRLRLEADWLKGRLAQGAEAIGDILERREPVLSYTTLHIKKTLPLLEYVERLTHLDAGEDGWEGKCPIPQHQGDSKIIVTPFFWKCGGCGVQKGDVIELVRRAKALPFMEVVRQLRRDALARTNKDPPLP